ncbi:hypothetical protein FRC12_022889 [Ceratobasidium sp. 428]|nr:hypothetical protein FRC12_022889 [Ceratobasidium sp. 428]
MLCSGNKREADKASAEKHRLTKERKARSQSAHSKRSTTFNEVKWSISPENQPNPDTDSNLNSQQTWWEQAITRKEIIKTLQDFCVDDLNDASDGKLENLYHMTKTAGEQPPPAQQREAGVYMDIDPPEELKLTPSQRRNHRRRRSKSKQKSPTPPSAPVPSSAGANALTSSTPAQTPALALAPALAPASALNQAPVPSPTRASASAPAQAPIALTDPDSLDPDGTATQPTSDNENGPPPIKLSRKRKLPVTALSPPASNANSEAKSENALPPRETVTLRLSYPNKPQSQPSHPAPKPHPPTSQSHPSTSQSSPPASQPRCPSQPSKVTEVVPKTDSNILAERVPHPRPATYSQTRSHISSSLYPLDPKKALLDYALWRDSVRTRPPLNLPAGAGPSHAPNRLVAPTPNHHLSDALKRKADLAAKRDAARATFHETANPSNPAQDAQCNMIHDKDDEEAEDQGDGDEEDENKDEDTRHGEQILMKSGRTQKPVTNDLKGRLRAAATVAKLLLYLYAVVFGPYLERKTYLLWLEIVYKIAWYYVYPKLPFKKPLQIVYTIMVNNLATLKCNAKLVGQAILKPVFGLLRPAMTRFDIDHNLNILREIYPLWFHCTDPWGCRGHFEGLIIPRAITAILFYGKSLVGVLFHKYLEPIPTITLAYILTVIEFCLSEWMVPGSKGIHTLCRLGQAGWGRMQNMWLSQMENIHRFQANTEGRLDRLCADWFKYALVYSGASVTDDDTNSLQNLLDATEFRPATPEPGSLPPESPHDASLNPSNSEAGPSSHRTRHSYKPAGDHEVAMSWQQAEYEAASAEANEEVGEAEYVKASQGGPMDLDSQPQQLRESSYEFPDPMTTPPQVDEEGRYTSASKGKGRN